MTKTLKLKDRQYKTLATSNRILATVIGLFFSIYLLPQRAHAYSLLESYHKAQNYDAQLKIAYSNLTINQTVSRQAKSPLLPQINAQLSYVNSKVEQSTDQSPIQIPDSSLKRKNFQIGLSQQLFDLEKWYVFKSAQASADGAHAEYGKSVQSLIERVSIAYFDVLKAQANLDNDNAEADAFKQQHKSITLYYDNGLLSITDLLEAEAASDLAAAKKLISENQLDIAKATLESLTGEELKTVWSISNDLPIKDIDPSTKEEWSTIAHERNWSVIASQHQLKAAHINVRAKKLIRLPTVKATLSYNNLNNEGPLVTLNNQEKSKQATKSANIELNIPLYNGGSISSAQKKASAEKQLQRHNHTNLLRNISLETQRLFLTDKALQLQINAQQRALNSAEAVVKTTRFSFDNGVKNITDLILAQSALFDAKRNYDTTRIEHITTRLALKNIAGVLNEKDIIEINNWLSPRAVQK